jgi:hypothetical protein
MSLQKRDLKTVRSSAFSFSFHYLQFSLRFTSICLRLLSRLPVTSRFPSITCFRNRSCSICDQTIQPSFLLPYIDIIIIVIIIIIIIIIIMSCEVLGVLSVLYPSRLSWSFHLFLGRPMLYRHFIKMLILYYV